jgi:hypothetical protein
MEFVGHPTDARVKMAVCLGSARYDYHMAASRPSDARMMAGDTVLQRPCALPVYSAPIMQQFFQTFFLCVCFCFCFCFCNESNLLVGLTNKKRFISSKSLFRL